MGQLVQHSLASASARRRFLAGTIRPPVRLLADPLAARGRARGAPPHRADPRCDGTRALHPGFRFEPGARERASGCSLILAACRAVGDHLSAGVLDRLPHERAASRGAPLPDMPPGTPLVTGRKRVAFESSEIARQPAGGPRVGANE